MNHYVYRTARGLLRTVHAEDPWNAWQTAAKKHKPEGMWNLDGEGWGESMRGGAIRERALDVPAGHAQVLYFDACATEISHAARSMLHDLAAGRIATYSCQGRSQHGGAVKTQFALVERGLVTGMQASATLTDLGKAFVKHVGGS